MCKSRLDSQNVSSDITGVDDTVVNTLRICGCSLTTPVLALPLTCCHSESETSHYARVSVKGKSWFRGSGSHFCHKESITWRDVFSISASPSSAGLTEAVFLHYILCRSHLVQFHLFQDSDFLQCYKEPCLKGFQVLLLQSRKTIITSPGIVRLSCLLFDSPKKN